MNNQTAIDRQTLKERLEIARRVMRSHGGGLEVSAPGTDGVLSVRLTGMCGACPMKALTAQSTIEPLLGTIPGVTRVDVQGARISGYAMRRLKRISGAQPDFAPLIPIEPHITQENES